MEEQLTWEQRVVRNEAWHGIKAEQVSLQVNGLQNSYTFFQLTDLHMAELTPEESVAMSEERRTYVVKRYYEFAREDIPTSNRLPAYLELAKSEGADLIVMTGDMIDYPSDANLKIMEEVVLNGEIPTMYVLGNHDWSFADDWHTENAKAEHLPKFQKFVEQGVHIHWKEYEDLLVVAVDNTLDTVSDDVVDAFLALYEKQKPIVLIMHIPLYEESLAVKTESIWRSPMLIMGGKCLNGDVPAVKRFYEAVALDPNTPVVAVLAGHVHFHYHVQLPNGVPQYVTDKAYTGGCMTLRLHP